MIPNERGFDLSSPDSTAAILVTTIVQNLRKLDPTLHMDHKTLHLVSIEQVWLELLQSLLKLYQPLLIIVYIMWLSYLSVL